MKSFGALLCLLLAALGSQAAESEPAPGSLVATNALRFPQAAAHWAFRTPILSPEPATKDRDWGRTSIDAFILARLETQNLSPSPEADRATLIRRLSFDLIGLPPSPAEVAGFLADRQPDAYERLVERLLASPHYGERWGRHWLDVAGYADSNGYFDADSDRPLAWKYRDYVVQSFNADKPFDQFVREQLAGDELAGYTPGDDITPATMELLTATHFLRNAPDGTGESDGNAAELRADRYAVLEGNVQIIGSALLGLTVQCARCHDHKFEPVTQEDYYGLQAVLKPVYNHDQWRKPNERAVSIGTRAEREENKRLLGRFERELKTMKEALEGLTAPYRKLVQEEALEKLPASLRTEVRKALDTKEKARSEPMKALLKTNEAVLQTTDEHLAKRFPEFAEASGSFNGALKKKEGERPKSLPELAIATDLTPAPPPHHVLVRGAYGNPGREAPPAAPAILGGSRRSLAAALDDRPPLKSSGRPDNEQPTTNNQQHVDDRPALKSSGRRLAFARWVTSPEHPTFARLAVNRVWQQHFGVGLVATPDNFGLTGARPTHPELLDHLAAGFIRSGWSVKSLHRLIVNSATYRQAATGVPSSEFRVPSSTPGSTRNPKFETRHLEDPDNHLFWRFPLRRLDAEALRDAMLSVSGEIDWQSGGPFVPSEKTEEGQYGPGEKNPGAKRRSLYLQQRRTKPDTFLDLFDGVKLNPNCAQRTTSTMSLQSLALLNSVFARARSRAFARRLAVEAGEATDARLALAFQLTVARPPTRAEREAAEKFLETQKTHYAGQQSPDENVWTDFGQMLLAGNAFLYVE